jgi:hypothetical protein
VIWNQSRLEGDGLLDLVEDAYQSEDAFHSKSQLTVWAVLVVTIELLLDGFLRQIVVFGAGLQERVVRSAGSR